eukprot:Anaeramoba_ignava/c18513_g1_i3.p1 GENE.c18513_g1_i3~~c18513_g1_i3.p1  ORF type:complete len:129 (-),score=52.24 c18513_g1_i3:73-459(-)
MKIYVQTSTGKIFPYDINEYDSILKLKQLIESTQGIPVANQKLTYQGSDLRNDQNIKECNIMQETTINLVFTSGENDSTITYQSTTYQSNPNYQTTTTTSYQNTPDYQTQTYQTQTYQVQPKMKCIIL